MPPITALPNGCPYHPRCPRATEECRAFMPDMKQGVACYHPLLSAEETV